MLQERVVSSSCVCSTAASQAWRKEREATLETEPFPPSSIRRLGSEEIKGCCVSSRLCSPRFEEPESYFGESSKSLVSDE
ncbi:hypothetical protein B0H16DRAFT_1726257 [Mycena metata]|uniref:Uncharacterized protein n=1 Tax=Mycena metata TaxID=1033252 RepID=A0AAD7N710_9AGAR|nr:hypothetical protein B0H16DRAFT_1726257 [Mycena metata]